MKKNKKPRQEYIYATTADIVDNIVFSIDPITNNIRFETKVEGAYNEVNYYRQKGPKVISRTPQDRDDLSFNPNEIIQNNYQIIFAVDTNTQIIRGNKISVTGIIQSQRVFLIDDDGVAEDFWFYFTPFCIELMEVQEKPENLGWYLAIKYILTEAKFDEFDKIAVIIDSDLGLINKFNSRKKPIIKNVYLPERFQLIYASADIGKEYFANQMLSHADKASSQCLQALNDGIFPINSEKVENEFYSGIRYLYSMYK